MQRLGNPNGHGFDGIDALLALMTVATLMVMVVNWQDREIPGFALAVLLGLFAGRRRKRD